MYVMLLGPEQAAGSARQPPDFPWPLLLIHCDGGNELKGT